MLNSLSLEKPIGYGYSLVPEDVLKTKTVLGELGFYKKPKSGITPWPDTPMFDGLKTFQKQKKLKVDGLMKPGGPTEKMLGRVLGRTLLLTSTDNVQDKKQPIAMKTMEAKLKLDPQQKQDAPVREVMPATHKDKPQLIPLQKTAPAVSSEKPQGTVPLSAKQKAELSHLSPEFKEFLYSKESSTGPNNGYGAIGKGNDPALGRYQMTKVALQDAGLKDGEGNWTKKDGIKNRKDFLNNPAAQERAFSRYMKKNETYLRDNGADKFINREITGLKDPSKPIRITRAGLMAAAHRQGNEAVRQYMEAQEKNGWDSNKYIGTNNEEKFRSIETRLRLGQDIPYERRTPPTR